MKALKTAEVYTRDTWLDMRERGAKQGHLGASQIASALGINPYKPAFVLHQQMTGRLPLDEENIAMRLGRHDEPFVATLYQEHEHCAVIDPGAYAVWRHPEHEWLFATPDYIRDIHDKARPVECKRSDSRNKHRWANGVTMSDGTAIDGIAPIEYEAQLYGQMACLGADDGDIVGLVGYELFVVQKKLKKAAWEWVLDGLERFRWHVLNDIAPDVDGSAACSQALKVLHPDDNGETVDLPPSAARDIKRWQRWGAIKRTAEKQEALHKNRLIAAIGDASYGVVDGLKVSCKTQTRPAHEVKAATFRVLRKAK